RLVFDSTANTFKIFVDNTELDAATEKQTLNDAGISFVRFLADGQEGQLCIDNVALMIYEPNKTKAAVEMDALNVKFSDFTSQSPDAVTRDLVFPTEATFGSTLTYINEEESDVLSNFGFVTRQDKDVTFPLIVKVKNGSEEKILPPFQITVKGQDPKNLVLNKIIYVSNELAGYEAANAVDQVETTAWKTDAPNPFLTVNLGKETMINKVILKEAQNESDVFGVEGFTIEISNNNRTWTPVYSDGTTIGESIAVKFDEVSAKYVRYSVTAFDGTQTGLYELGIYYEPIPSIAIELDLADIKITPSDYIVSSNLSLTSACTNGSAVSWKSSHPAIISHSGALLATPERDTVVTLTATLQNGTETRTKDFKVLVCAGRSGGGSGGGTGGGGSSSPVKGVTSSGIINPQNGSEVVSQPSSVFPDVQAERWSHDFIKELKEAGIVEGDGGNFHPTRTVTREEFVKMLVLSLDITPGGTVAFSDAENGAWYEAFIAAAVYNGIVQGVSDETFGIGQEISRHDMAVMVMRALAAKDKTIELGAAPIFSDGSKIAPYAKDAVAYLAAAGILGGDGENFNPEESLTREQAAKVLCMIRKELAS
ncbi:MAG: S-layer homology domain-containing protein, partial [Clostridia bacterium]